MRATRSRISAPSRRRQILRVATRLFARHGFNGTTTRQIADEVGVSEAIIFRHFSRKEHLYRAVLEEKCAAHDLGGSLAEKARTLHDDLEFLVSVGEDLLAHDVTLGRLLMFSALENHGLSHGFFLLQLAPYQQAVCERIRQGVKQGRFRGVDAALAARAFLGMLLYQSQLEGLYRGRRLRRADRRHMCEALASIWLSGIGLPAGNGEPQPRPDVDNSPVHAYTEIAAIEYSVRDNGNGNSNGNGNGRHPRVQVKKFTKT